MVALPHVIILLVQTDNFILPVHFFSSIFLKSSCPFPPDDEVATDWVVSDCPIALTWDCLNPSPAFGFDGPSRLGLNKAWLSVLCADPLARDAGMSSLK